MYIIGEQKLPLTTKDSYPRSSRTKIEGGSSVVSARKEQLLLLLSWEECVKEGLTSEVNDKEKTTTR